MNSVKRASFSAAFGICLLALAHASARADESGASPVVVQSGPAASLVRADWEQRVLRPVSAGASQAGVPASGQVAPQSRLARGATSAGRVRGVTYQGEPLLLDSNSASDIHYQPIPGGAAEAVTACGPDGMGACGPCGDGYGEVCGPAVEACWPMIGPGVLACWPHSFSFFAGVQGFKGPVDFGRNGNFGFHEGVQWAAPLGGFGRLGYELGFQAVQSDFYGNQALGDFHTGDRDQLFFTAGIFHRAMCDGLQWGVALDLLHDAYWAKADVNQVRAEISLVRQGCREIGFWGAFGTGQDTVMVNDTQLQLAPTDLFAFFYRSRTDSGAVWRLWAGFTGESDGMVGGELTVPLSHNWALENRANFLLPKQSSDAGGQTEESWGITINLVWYPGRCIDDPHSNPYRPLLGVADNSVFMVDVE